MPGGFYGFYGFLTPNTNMDVLQQSRLILVTLTSKGKFLYILGGAGPESAVLH